MAPNPPRILILKPSIQYTGRNGPKVDHPGPKVDYLNFPKIGMKKSLKKNLKSSAGWIITLLAIRTRSKVTPLDQPSGKPPDH